MGVKSTKYEAVTLASSIFELYQDPTASPDVYSGKLILLPTMIISHSTCYPFKTLDAEKPASFSAKGPSLNKLISYENFTNCLEIWSEDS